MQHLLLLHGAIGAADQLYPLAEILSAHFYVHTINFSGHGPQLPADEPFSIELFAADVLRFMKEKEIETASLFGYSMGGYVAMHLACGHPEKIDKVITLATKYHWDEAIAEREMQMLDPVKIERKVPAFAAALKSRHSQSDWKTVLKKTAEMMADLGKTSVLSADRLSSIVVPVLILLGDRDKMVSLEETVAVYKVLPSAQLGIIPNTPHPIEQVDMHFLSSLIKGFAG
jgi:pimeloyl-ACP methyl ester carboxylesterase